MSDKSKRPRSGEFDLTSHRAKDGTLEYVIGDESSSPIEDAAPPSKASATSSATSSSKTPLFLGVGVFVAVVIATIAFFASSEDEPRVDQDDEVEQVGFKAYSGSVPPPKAPAPRKKAPEVDDDIPEELAGWDLDETDEEVIVIEEYDGEPEPEVKVVQNDPEPGPGEPYTREHEKSTLTDHGRSRFASPEQRKLLRQFNEQLDRGERPIIPKANMPSALRPISPKMQNLDNISGPKFLPGKLHRVTKKEKSQPME